MNKKDNNKLLKVRCSNDSSGQETLSECINVTPEQKVAFYEEEHQYYIQRLEKKACKEFFDNRFGHLANKEEKNFPDRQGKDSLKYDEKLSWYLKIETLINTSSPNRLSMLLYVIKRVLPSMCDSTPLEFIYKAIVDNDINKILTFMQIAAFRWALIEKRCITQTLSRFGREGNAYTNTKEAGLLQELYEKIYYFATKKGNEENGFSFYFNPIYRDEMLPILLDSGLITETLKKMRKKQTKKTSKGSRQKAKMKLDPIDQLLNELSTGNDKKHMLNKLETFEPLKKHYYDKCLRVMERFEKDTHLLYFKSIDKSFYLDELNNTIWKELDPWPLAAVLQEYNEPLNNAREIAIIESIKFYLMLKGTDFTAK